MRILLPIDDSKFSQAAVQVVSSQVRPKGTEVRIFHVVEPISAYISAELFPHWVRHDAATEEDRQKQAKALVQRAAHTLRKAGFRTSEVVEVGNPKIKIIDHATRWHADLIVVGSHGWKGLNRFLLGSVSEAVTRHAGCSVQVVRIPNAKRPARTRRSA